MHAEAVLLVDHGEGEVLERHVRLEQRVRADQDVDLAGLEPLQQRLARLALLAPGEQANGQTGMIGQRRDGLRVLPRQHLGGRHEGRLRARLHGDGHGQQRHHGLAGAHVALQQPQHAEGGGDVLRDLLQRLALRVGKGEGERVGNPGADAAVAHHAAPRLLLEAQAHQPQRQLAGEQLVERQPLPGRRAGRDILRLGRLVQARERGPPVRPAAPLEPRLVLPFRQLRHLLQRAAHGLQQHLAGETRGQRIDRLQHRQLGTGLRRHDVVRVRHLLLVVVGVDAPADEAQAALGQLALDEPGIGVEEDQVDAAGLVLAAHLVGGLGVALRRPAVPEHPHA